MPAYNAARTIPQVIERVPESVWASLASFWIIDDGSTDDTADTIKQMQASHPHIRGVSFDVNRGYGSAVKEGLTRCRKDESDFIVCLHADGQYPPESIPEFMRVMKENNLDVLQGSRIASGTAISGGMPRYKYVAGRLLTWMENRVFGLSMTDYHSGFLMYSRRAIEQIPFQSLSPSFDIDLEIIASARAGGLSIGERPIPTRYADEESHLNPVGYGFRVLGVMGKFISGRYHGEQR